MRQHRKRQEKTVFKSCPRVGGHLSEEPGQGWRCCVSSRAPVWGHPITRFTRSEVIQFQVVPPCGGINMAKHISDTRASFKSCPPWGASFSSMPFMLASNAFQVVPPCGGHRRGAAGHLHRGRFKSCPRVGGHHMPTLVDMRPTLFQVVPPCGGASVARLSVILSTVFQVVPPCGGHLPGKIRDFLDAGFQVVPPCGGIVALFLG